MNTAAETQTFFRLSTELRQAEASGPTHLLDEALDELVVFWAYTTNPKVRGRCAEILENRGQRAAMDLICQQLAS